MAVTTIAFRPGQVHELVIDSAGTGSDLLQLNAKASRAVVLLIIAPDTLTAAVHAEVSHDGVTFVPLLSGGSPITFAVSTATVITILPGTGYFRLLSAGAEGADRTFEVSGNWHAAS